MVSPVTIQRQVNSHEVGGRCIVNAIHPQPAYSALRISLSNLRSNDQPTSPLSLPLMFPSSSGWFRTPPRPRPCSSSADSSGASDAASVCTAARRVSSAKDRRTKSSASSWSAAHALHTKAKLWHTFHTASHILHSSAGRKKVAAMRRHSRHSGAFSSYAC